MLFPVVHKTLGANYSELLLSEIITIFKKIMEVYRIEKNKERY
jgi:hypothetical protein